MGLFSFYFILFELSFLSVFSFFQPFQLIFHAIDVKCTQSVWDVSLNYESMIHLVVLTHSYLIHHLSIHLLTPQQTFLLNTFYTDPYISILRSIFASFSKKRKIYLIGDPSIFGLSEFTLYFQFF